MTALQQFTAIGAFIYGALYLTFCLIAGFVTMTPFAWKLALASAGFCFLTFVFQHIELNRYLCGTAAAASIVAGAFAGVALMIR